MPDTKVEIEVGKLPAMYSVLGVETGYKPFSATKLRCYFRGPRFGGKSTFVSGRPKTLILDFENGAWGVPSKFQRAYRVPIPNWEVMHKVLEALALDAKNPARPFDHVALDTADAWVELCASYLASMYRDEKWQGTDIRQWGQKGAGYSILTEYCWGLITTLEKSGYSWTIMGHIKEKEITVNGKEITVVRPVLYDMLHSVLSRNADVVATIEPVIVQVPQYKTIVGSGKQVEVGTTSEKRIQFNASVQETGFGSGTGKLRGVANLDMTFTLPDFKSGEVGWDKFVKEFDEATAKVRNGQFD